MTDKQPPMVDYALWYGSRGVPVFPCNPVPDPPPDARPKGYRKREKRPLVAGADKDKDGNKIPETGGLYRATTDEKQIRAWWKRHPNALIGCPMGARTGVFVIDLDPDGEPTKAVYDRLVAAVGDLPDGPLVLTQSGGMHLYFRLPDGEKSMPANSAKRLKNVDWRGQGGYVILPPSRMTDGKAYEWQDGKPPEIGTDERGRTGILMAPTPPPKLLDLVYQRGDFTPEKLRARRAGQGSRSKRASSADVVELRAGYDNIRAYAQAALKNAEDELAGLTEGSRNHTLNAKAYALVPFIELGHLTRPQVEEALERGAEKCGLTKDDGLASVRATIESGLSSRNADGVARLSAKMAEITAEAGRKPSRRGRKRGGAGGDPGAPGYAVPLIKPLPDDCPVHALGREGENFYFIDAMGQLFETGTAQLGQDRIRRLFGPRVDYLYAHWPRYSKEGKLEGWRAERVAESLYDAGSKKGIWNAFDRVRGRGAWLGKKGELIIHSGAHLTVAGRRIEAGTEIDGYFYPSLPAIAAPQPRAVKVDDNPAPRLFEAFRSWTWERPKVDPFLLLGWVGAAMLGGALDWRPSMFIIGDKGTGKSTLQFIIKELFGGGVISTPETTAAGIYQQVKHDSLPIAVDELESEVDSRRATAVVKLARLAASGGLMLRGGQDHTGVQFQARSCFLFSAVNPPPMTAADWSRLAVLSVRRLDTATIAKRPEIPRIDTIAPMLLRHLIDNWARFPAQYEAYKEALFEGGHDSRGQETYGTFLACADILLGPEGMERFGYDFESLGFWTEALSAAALPEIANQEENWKDCIDHLLSARVEAWRGGVMPTVGGSLDEFSNAGDVEFTLEALNNRLSSAGLKVLKRMNGIADGSLILCVPSSGPDVAALFKDTKWREGVWPSALRQAPGHIVVTSKDKNLHRISGRPRRCILIILDALDRYAMDAAGGAATVAG